MVLCRRPMMGRVMEGSGTECASHLQGAVGAEETLKLTQGPIQAGGSRTKHEKPANIISSHVQMNKTQLVCSLGEGSDTPTTSKLQLCP